MLPSKSASPSSSRQTRTKFNTPSSLTFNFVFSLLAVTILHGLNALKIFFILFLNYSIAKNFKGSKMNVLLTWLFNGAVLLGNEVFEGWRLGHWSEGLAWLVRSLGLHDLSSSITPVHLGYIRRNLPSVVYQLQHHDAATRVFQHGLLLGL